MKIGITGATGLIGRSLCKSLIRKGGSLRLFLRSPSSFSADFSPESIILWDVSQGPVDPKSLSDLDAVIHLAGEPIAGRRWSKKKKSRIRTSRIDGTRNLFLGLKDCASRPKTLISSSAIGFYGNRGAEALEEESGRGVGFLADVCHSWEAEALKVSQLGMRVVLLRTGIVLSAHGGALASMLPAFKFFVGGRLGSGRQYMSWIHIQDEIRLIEFVLESPIQGALNATSPGPVTNSEFTRTLGSVLRRPTIFPVPAMFLRLLLGEMAQQLLLEGQRMLPAKAKRSGFEYRFPQLKEALKDLLS